MGETLPKWASPTTTGGQLPPEPAPAEKTVQTESREFSPADIAPETQGPGKMVIVVHGEKGAGKTTTLYSLPGRKLVLTFDNKSQGIWAGEPFRFDPNIKIVNAVRYYKDTQPEEITESADKTIRYLKYAIEQYKESWRPDWVILDAFEVIEQLAEMKMRYMHKVGPTQGFAELSWWKDRRIIIRDIYRSALDAALMGVAMSVYTEYKNIIEEGSIRATKKAPRYVDAVLMETDIVMEATSEYAPLIKDYMFKVQCNTAKAGFKDVVRTGESFDTTGGKLVPWHEGMAQRYALLHPEAATQATPQFAAGVPKETQSIIADLPPDLQQPVANIANAVAGLGQSPGPVAPSPPIVKPRRARL